LLDLVLRSARLSDRPDTLDVGIAAGHIRHIGTHIGESCRHVMDLGDRLLIPGFVDAHLHLDKAFLNEDPSLRGLTGTEFFSALSRAKRDWTLSSVTERMRRALASASDHGTTTVRAQVDVDDIVQTRGIEAALSLRSGGLRMQVVAFPQEGLARADMRAALRLGADVVGGGAAFDAASAEAHVQALFELATEFDVDLDIHADLHTSPSAPLEDWEISHIARATREAGWQGRVTVAHLTQLGQMPQDRATDVACLLAESGVQVTVVPGAELNTATTWEATPATSVDQAMTRLDVLLRGGVNVSYATGHVADAFSPFGRGDMLLEGLVLACARNLGQPRIAGTHVLDLGTTHPARTLRMGGPYGVVEGARADLVCLDAQDADHALRHHASVFWRMRA
jgi:cytosine deaminase